MKKKTKPISAKQFIRDNLEKYPTKEQMIKECHRVTNTSEKRIVMLFNKAKLTGGNVIMSTKPRGKSIDAFTMQYDWQARIKMTINKELMKKNAQVFTDAEFRVLCNVPQHKWRASTNTPEFDEYKVRIKDVWYWTSKANVERIKSLDV